MRTTSPLLLKWGLFLSICLIWGSSFILMKEGLKGFQPIEVASIRMLTAGLVLLPASIRNFNKVPRNRIGYILASGWLGSFIPAILFCLAEERIDSSLAGFLNSLTPLLTIVIGALFFKRRFAAGKILGVAIGLIGMILLFWGAPGTGRTSSFYALLVLMATVFYAVNVNLVAKQLHDVPSLPITAIACTALVVPALLILGVTGFFHMNFSSPVVWKALGAGTLLGVLGTAGATILFYLLLKKSGPVFTSMVTYGIPFVALGWGLLAGETIGAVQVGGLVIILSGVYMANKA